MTGGYGKNRLFLSFSVIQNTQNNEIKTPEFSSENRGYHRVRPEGLEPSTNGLRVLWYYHVTPNIVKHNCF